MQDMVREALQDEDWVFKNSIENGVSMEAEELNGTEGTEDVLDDTALTPKELVIMINGGEVHVDEHGGFLARSAADEELTNEDAEDESDEEYIAAGM